MISVRAPAKINVSLRVKSVDQTGFHPLDSVVHMLDWYDELDVESAESDVLEVRAAHELPGAADGVPTGPSNLVWTCADAIAPDRPALSVLIRKSIPTAAGLAGGSADAAGMAVALERLIGDRVDLGRLASVGADVPFSVMGGTARMTGYGEVLQPLPAVDGFAVVVAVPPVEVSTPAVYKAWDALGEPSGDEFRIVDLPDSLARVDAVNDLTPAALHLEPSIGRYRELLVDRWGRQVAMSGSGPSLFAYFADRDEAQAAAADIAGLGFRAVRACRPVATGTELIPASD